MITFHSSERPRLSNKLLIYWLRPATFSSRRLPIRCGRGCGRGCRRGCGRGYHSHLSTRTSTARTPLAPPIVYEAKSSDREDVEKTEDDAETPNGVKLFAHSLIGVLPFKFVVLGGLDVLVDRAEELGGVPVIGKLVAVHAAYRLPYHDCHDESKDERYAFAKNDDYRHNYLVHSGFGYDFAYVPCEENRNHNEHEENDNLFSNVSLDTL